jgi:hypothetical protein
MRAMPGCRSPASVTIFYTWSFPPGTTYITLPRPRRPAPAVHTATPLPRKVLPSLVRVLFCHQMALNMCLYRYIKSCTDFYIPEPEIGTFQTIDWHFHDEFRTLSPKITRPSIGKLA